MAAVCRKPHVNPRFQGKSCRKVSVKNYMSAEIGSIGRLCENSEQAVFEHEKELRITLAEIKNAIQVIYECRFFARRKYK
jgi:hypothetical protein